VKKQKRGIFRVMQDEKMFKNQNSDKFLPIVPSPPSPEMYPIKQP
jgi:hypothetical protein